MPVVLPFKEVTQSETKNDFDLGDAGLASSRSELTTTVRPRNSVRFERHILDAWRAIKMGSINRDNSKQDKHSASCRRSGKMAVLTRCGACGRSVVGVIMCEMPSQYCIECKCCGYSATSHFSDDQQPTEDLGKA